MNLRRYLDVLRAPGVARVAAFALLGRLPFGTLPLSIVLFMRHEGYAYGQIGAVVATEALAVGLTAVFIGRLVDRVGHARVLITTGVLTGIAICVQTAAIASGRTWRCSWRSARFRERPCRRSRPSMRALWRELVPEDRVETAYAFDSVALELAFIVGPLIAAGLAAAWTPLAGMLALRRLLHRRGGRLRARPGLARVAAGGERRAHARGRAPVARDPHAAAAAACAAMAFGALEVALTAFAEEQGTRGAVGPLSRCGRSARSSAGCVRGAHVVSPPRRAGS